MMMVKINNPYAERKDYNCFGCSPNNEHGLQMEFYVEGGCSNFILESLNHNLPGGKIFYMEESNPR